MESPRIRTRDGARVGLAALVVMLMLGIFIPFGHAQSEATVELDQRRIELGDSVVLTIRTHDAAAIPDTAPLTADFVVGPAGRTQEVRIYNFRKTESARWSYALTPKRSGELVIPALRVGQAFTSPLKLTVAPATDASTAGPDEVFMEVRVADRDPYVQQNVGVALRLYSRTSIISGQLEFAPPQGAILQRIGQDVEYRDSIDGREYAVVERRYLLVAERSGELTLPAPRFTGRLLGQSAQDPRRRSSRIVSLSGDRTVLRIRARPPEVTDDWLPLHGLSLRYLEAPERAALGSATTVEIEVRAQGGVRAQFLNFPEIASTAEMQILPEPPRFEETFDNGQPSLRMTRRYSIVPLRPGAVAFPGLRMRWWNVDAERAVETQLPALLLAVPDDESTTSVHNDSPVAASSPSRNESLPANDEALHGPLSAQPTKEKARIPIRAVFAVVLAVIACLAVLGTIFKKRKNARSNAVYTLSDLQQAIVKSDLKHVREILFQMAGLDTQAVSELLVRLDDPVQREAVMQMETARWSEREVAPVLDRLRHAFEKAPRWRVSRPDDTSMSLAPLYPRRRPID